MEKTFSPKRRGRIVTPAKEKAHQENGLENRNFVATDYSKPKPETLIQNGSHLRGNQRRLALSRAFSAYWQAMMAKGLDHD